MDFGIGFLSNNVMLPIIDLFYGFVPSYGLAIVALTLIIRFALYPLSAGSIRSMRRMRVVQPLMQKRMAEIKERYKDDQQKQQEEMLKVQSEFGNPLAGCLPLLLQMPVLLALFATLRGSPFAGVNYSVNLQIFPEEQIERIQPQAFATSPQNIYIADYVYYFTPNDIEKNNRIELDKLLDELLNILISKFGYSEPKELPINKNIYKWLGGIDPNYISKFYLYKVIHGFWREAKIRKDRRQFDFFITNSLRITPAYE
jgi:YidC/Oxa1 family membrane protein insertase